MSEAKPVIPALVPVYSALEPAAHAFARIVAGVGLAIHGWPKITNPTGAAGMVESLGFAPPVFWSVLLSCTEFLTGILLIVGLLTRPAAGAAAVILAVTVYAHWVAFGQGYDGAEKSILWFALLVWLAMRGGGKYSVDRLGRHEI